MEDQKKILGKPIDAILARCFIFYHNFLSKQIFRYEKTINCSISYFLKHDLYAFFLATNAPGRSAFNRVERRMAPLSHDLAGVVLPHNSFGSHLNSQNETIDAELEMKNFAKAGEVLAEIWSQTVIDGYATVVECIHPETDEVPVEQDPQGYGKHVREMIHHAANHEEVLFFISSLKDFYLLLYPFHKANTGSNMERINAVTHFFQYLLILQ